jgi:hypothetical protein
MSREAKVYGGGTMACFYRWVPGKKRGEGTALGRGVTAKVGLMEPWLPRKDLPMMP